jgi:hypothetical protein
MKKKENLEDKARILDLTVLLNLLMESLETNGGEQSVNLVAKIGNKAA